MDVGSDRDEGKIHEGVEPARLRWFAVNTQPNSEQRAQVNLERQGYIFVTMNPAQSRWRSVDGTFGVRAIVKSGDLPAPLPVGVVETLIAMADGAGKVSFASSLNPGQDVRFLSGPLAGLIGRLEHLDAAGRVTVLLDLLGRATPIRGHASELAPSSGN